MLLAGAAVLSATRCSSISNRADSGVLGPAGRDRRMALELLSKTVICVLIFDGGLGQGSRALHTVLLVGGIWSNLIRARFVAHFRFGSAMKLLWDADLLEAPAKSRASSGRFKKKGAGPDASEEAPSPAAAILWAAGSRAPRPRGSVTESYVVGS